VEGHLSELGDTGLSWCAILAVLYALLRFVEATGLWLQKHWAEWVAVIGASIYLPFEVARILKKPDCFGFLIFGVNLFILAYLSRVLIVQRRERKALKAQAQATPPPKPEGSGAKIAGF